MRKTLTAELGAAALTMLSVAGAQAANDAISTVDAANGIYDIYSATFDGALSPCTIASPPQCTFFGGDPPAARTVSIAPNPTGVGNIVPLGINPTPPSGSYLNLSLSGGNTQVTIHGGVIALPSISLTIPGTPPTVVTTTPGAGWVFASGPHTTPVDGSRRAVFQVDLAPALAADFSMLGAVTQSCSGPFCVLFVSNVLSLDMIRYRLVLQYNPTFTSFTGQFEGQGSGGTLVFANLNSTSGDADPDGDNVPDALDNCPTNANADQLDTDFDGIGNACDKCTLLYNPDQRDTNGDGYGNLCDADLNNDGIVNINDLNRLKARLNIVPVVDVDTDLDGNDSVNINDLSRLKSFLGKPPGPSGSHPNCPPTCP